MVRVPVAVVNEWPPTISQFAGRTFATSTGLAGWFIAAAQIEFREDVDDEEVA